MPGGRKYTHLSGGTNSSLYGAQDLVFSIDEDWFITESELDCLRLRSYGYNAVSVSSASVAATRDGSLNIEKSQIENLSQNPSRIFLALDMDAAGQRCAEAFEKAFPPYKTYRLTWPYGGKQSGEYKDIGDFPCEGFRDRIDRLVSDALGRKKRTVYAYCDLPKAYELSLNVEKIDWLVRDILPLNDKSILSGYWGNYKSYLALSLAKAVSTGQKFLNVYDTQKRPVIYLDRENSGNEIGRRAGLLRIPADAELRVWCERNVPFPAVDDLRLLSFAEELKPLVIVDTLTGFSEAEDENAAREMRRELERYHALTTRGATVLVLHHPPKDRSGVNDTNWFRGSGDVGAFFSMGFYVHCTDSERGIIEFKTMKSRLGPKTQFTVQAWPYLDKQSERYIGDFAILAEENSTASDHPDADKLATLIRANPGVTRTALARQAPISEWKVRKLLEAGDGERWRSVRSGRERKFFPLSDKQQDLKAAA
jgi:AAA domain/Toprim-like